ncbi:hypothetical protein ACRALDRAFT_1068201 [Sodiomyces alcalophilus JCM 7366]|uniref:uncharacterized protein n=1 Tax=Sodiomyces alcalophilus JCM 7366 TaxID=591952 RepID=UPI0039B57B92
MLSLLSILSLDSQHDAVGSSPATTLARKIRRGGGRTRKKTRKLRWSGPCEEREFERPPNRKVIILNSAPYCRHVAHTHPLPPPPPPYRHSILSPRMNSTPIPGFDLSPSTLFAIADFHSIPDRTALRGGVSLFEVLVLAPGLQYQQSADDICGLYSRFPEALETLQPATTPGGGRAPGPAKIRHWPVHNHATLRFLQRVIHSDDFPCTMAPLASAAEDAGSSLEDSILVGNSGRGASVMRVWTFDVGLEVWPEMVPYTSYLDAAWKRAPKAVSWAGEKPMRSPDTSVKEDRTWMVAELVSHLLYLSIPPLTVAALVLCIMLRDWWGFNITLMLVFSRAINMIIIEERHDPDSVSMDPLPAMSTDSITLAPFDDTAASFVMPSTYWTQRSCGPDRKRKTEYVIPLSPSATVILRGTRRDLEAVTICGFLSPLSRRQGLLEGIAKALMYLAAALSGNLTQAGAIVLAFLLLISAAILGISNFFVRCLRVNGRVMYPALPSRQC